METLTTQTLIAMNMVDFWKKYRLDYIREPQMLAMIDKQIEEYEAQADHLIELQAEMILTSK
tara:strand:- start:417 stop:602 length:186 start_codon:yes stop_codon:yes gene_type:complete